MKVPLLDLKAQFAEIESEIRREIDDVLASQQFILGTKVEALEARIAEYCGVRNTICVSSGTDAILLALMALGVGSGDEVVTTPFTFFATAGCLARLGARPVFVDIDPDTLNLDVGAVANKVTSRTRAILPVHLFGRCVDVEALRSIVKIPVIEDAAQAFGAECRGARAGSLGAMGCFSFFPTKNLGAFGDGGAVTTNDDALAKKLRLLRGHGASTKYFHEIIGGNFRLDAIQAAVLLAKLPHVERWTTRREENATTYAESLAEMAFPRGPLRLPPLPPSGDRHVYNQYVVQLPKRDALAAHLRKEGVQTEIYYPRPMHLQECFVGLGYHEGDFPRAEAAAKTVLALPVAPELPVSLIRYVADQVKSFYTSSAS